jgi:aminoglycoside 3-N-acetyltransferase I
MNAQNHLLMIDIQVLSDKDLDEMIELISLFEDVFEMENFVCPDPKHLSKLLQKDNFIAITAKLDGKVIGGLTVYVLDQYYSTKPLAYIYDLAVLTAYQRKGIGRDLINFTNNYCRQKGFEEVFVQADQIDDYALDFYRSTKPTNEEQVVHFYYILEDDKHGA